MNRRKRIEMNVIQIARRESLLYADVSNDMTPFFSPDCARKQYKADRSSPSALWSKMEKNTDKMAI